MVVRVYGQTSFTKEAFSLNSDFGNLGKCPVVGLTLSYDFAIKRERYYIPVEYVDVVKKVGGIPLLLPSVNDDGIAKEFVERVDCLVLSGGGDIDPEYFGEQPLPKLEDVDPLRDEFEFKLISHALERKIPILGICRGMQILVVATGGTLYQDIESQVERPLQHRQKAPLWAGSHRIDVLENTRLRSILGCKQVRVNSFHHQAVAETGPCLAVSARASDGVIEAVESCESDVFVLGVQWHPELMWQREAVFLRLFRDLTQSVRTGKL